MNYLHQKAYGKLFQSLIQLSFLKYFSDIKIWNLSLFGFFTHTTLLLMMMKFKSGNLIHATFPLFFTILVNINTSIYHYNNDSFTHHSNSFFFQTDQHTSHHKSLFQTMHLQAPSVQAANKSITHLCSNTNQTSQTHTLSSEPTTIRLHGNDLKQAYVVWCCSILQNIFWLLILIHLHCACSDLFCI